MKTIYLVAAAIMMPVMAFADEGLNVVDAYARSANGKTGAMFMVIENHTQNECRLIGAQSDAAAKVELHTHQESGDGVMKMTQIEDGIAIAANDNHALSRGGDHVMLMGLTAPWQDGQEIKVTLDFGACGLLEAMVPVDNDRAADHASH